MVPRELIRVGYPFKWFWMLVQFELSRSSFINWVQKSQNSQNSTYLSRICNARFSKTIVVARIVFSNWTNSSRHHNLFLKKYFQREIMKAKLKGEKWPKINSKDNMDSFDTPKDHFMIIKRVSTAILDRTKVISWSWGQILYNTFTNDPLPIKDPWTSDRGTKQCSFEVFKI